MKAKVAVRLAYAAAFLVVVVLSFDLSRHPFAYLPIADALDSQASALVGAFAAGLFWPVVALAGMILLPFVVWPHWGGSLLMLFAAVSWLGFALHGAIMLEIAGDLGIQAPERAPWVVAAGLLMAVLAAVVLLGSFHLRVRSWLGRKLPRTR